ncbi:ORF59 [Leucania separata nucleopolyhedrovirus]|uniref:ORF59 n=1 Tax=Leucania separata nucleopolyhedrovirus TaxID=1307956 RepID=Q0IL60_NPVLS|nr:ORF59 [Leucania separata nucleopolyhedrovirus]AAR28823.1 ORF59 [Leucania separata nucleopolyhedrovirus]
MKSQHFIEPFVKYSRKYRELVDVEDRKKVRKQWLHAITYQCVVAEMPPPPNGECEFCATPTSCCRVIDEENDPAGISRHFCRTCFFPLFSCDNCCVMDSRIFALLSVYYWESVNKGCSSSNLYVVWRERIRIAWNFEMNSGDFFHRCQYVVKPDRCVQCDLECSDDDGSIYVNFDYRLFCEQCLFPRFVCLYDC